jgi:protein TonB
VLGAEAADVERAADQPAPPTPETMVEANPSDPVPPDPDPAHAPDPVATAAVTPPPPPTPRAPARPSLPLTLSLAGTDSASSAIAEGQALLPASPDNRSRNRPPVYPQEAVRRRLEGEVLLVIHVSSMGLAEGAEIVESSGHASLDRAAVDAVMTWRFRPAVRDGRPIGFDLPMRFGFTMR